MWRLFTSIPRAVRQQFHGSACSTVAHPAWPGGDEEEEKNEIKGRTVCDNRRFWLEPKAPAPGLFTPFTLGTSRAVKSHQPALESNLLTRTYQTDAKLVLPVHNDPKSAESPSTTSTDKLKAIKSTPLDVAIDEFKELCDKYSAMTSNIKALRLAKSGDYETALKLWTEASEIGYSKAQFNLGVCYQKGFGTKVDQQKAIELYKAAAKNGHQGAKRNLLSIKKSMDSKPP